MIFDRLSLLDGFSVCSFISVLVTAWVMLHCCHVGRRMAVRKKAPAGLARAWAARGRAGNRIWQGKIGRDVRGMSCITTYLLRGPTGGETSNAKESGVYGG